MTRLKMEPLVNTDQLIAVVPAITKYEHTYSKLLLMEVQNEIEVVAFIMHRTEDEETKNFTGEVMVTDLDGNFIIGYRVKQGMLTHTVFDNNNSNRSSTKCETDSSCGFHLSQGDLVVTAPDTRRTPYFYITHMYPPLGGGDGADNSYYSPGGGGATGSSTNNDSTEEDKIDTDELDNDCVKGIIGELQEKDDHYYVIPDFGTEVSHLSQIILDLFDNSEDYHLNFKIDDATNVNGEPRNAYTKGVWDSSERAYRITITLDENYVSNATQLAIARTIIHESIHGYLRYTYQEYPYSTFSELLRKYFNEMSDDEAHHLLMTQFAEALGSSLAAWDNYSLSNKDYYTAMAWSGGMVYTNEFNNLDEDFKDLIKDAIANEGSAVQEATDAAKGTTNCN